MGEAGIIPQRAWDIFKGRAHERITGLGNWVIPGHFNIILGLFIMAFTFGRGLSGGYMMRLAGRGIVDPVDATISQRCFDSSDRILTFGIRSIYSPSKVGIGCYKAVNYQPSS